MSISYRATDLGPIEPSTSTGQTHRLGLRAWGIAAVVFLFALCCYVPLLGDSPIASTEGHRALTAHEMVQSGEWLVPRMFGRIYLAKPPLHYWILGALEKLTGTATPLIWRLPAAVEGALLATILCLFGYRWFGEIGGVVSGFAYVGLFTMWGEQRGAELDATNTISATIAALCLIELHFGFPKRKLLWIIVAGIATGASFMVKGPASLTILLGVLAWAAIDALERRRAVEILRPSMWAPLLIGGAILGGYALAVKHYLVAHRLAQDMTGVQEGVQNAHPLDVIRMLTAARMPFLMFVYALPVSLAMPLNFFGALRESESPQRRLSTALGASVLLSWGVCFLAGMHNPRYGFVTLPLLAPLAGAVASRVQRLDSLRQNVLRNFVTGSGIGFALATLVLSVALRKHTELHAALLELSLAALLGMAALIYVLEIRKNWRGATIVLVLIVIASLVFAMMKNIERFQHTCLGEGLSIRQIVGADGSLVTCMMVLDQPDLFYFSGLPTKAYDGDQLDWRQLAHRQWAVLEKPELDKWNSEIPGRMTRVIEIKANGNPGWLVLYDPDAAQPLPPAPARHHVHHGGN